jgi:hypothetical protein
LKILVRGFLPGGGIADQFLAGLEIDKKNRVLQLPRRLWRSVEGDFLLTPPPELSR